MFLACGFSISIGYHRLFSHITFKASWPIRLPGPCFTSLQLNAPFNGTLVAPNAQVFFGTGAGMTFTGAFYAQSIDVRPGSTLVCLTSAATM